SLKVRGQGAATGARPPLLPIFLLGFVALVGVNSFGLIPSAVTGWLSSLSRWCLVVAIAGLGVKTSFQELAELGWRPVALMIGETLFLAALILGGLLTLR